ncbi:MAG: 3-deoxy-D-manno-octulosonic acid transferase [Alphaproteobacteria bacterium]|nr:3-deoxy-D-manno-octulosonic acid transferase [Alphaproteobacteria bacterium]
MLHYYRFASRLAAPLVPWWLRLRGLRGKEEKGRIGERFGRSSYGRPKGTLLWIHAASVGEANSVLALIQQLKQRFPALGILLTTGTVTSAALMKKRLPPGVLHHYAPVDTPEATERFIRHWHPDVAWFVESELWPNLIAAAKRYHCLMALINARMSQRSFAFWKKYPASAQEMLSAFHLCFAQSEADADRLRKLGAANVMVSGNLKYDAPLLPCHEGELLAMQKMVVGRRLWLAASTHAGEEEMVAKIHKELRGAHPNLLTVIVPRHPERGCDIARELQSSGKVALRSKQEPITSDTAFYIADTLGELGLFYRLCDVVFMGGSLVAHGGQNPLEPAQLACAILSGPHTHNFQDIYGDMAALHAAIIVKDPAALANNLHRLFTDAAIRSAFQACAKNFAGQKSGGSQMILDMFTPVLAS